MKSFGPLPGTNRRRFLRQSITFAALVALGSLPYIAASLPSDPEAAELMIA